MQARMEKGQLWELQRTLDGEKSNLRTTYQTQSDANHKVWKRNEQTETALALLATFYEGLEAANMDFCHMDKRFDGKFDQVEILSKKAAGAQKEAGQWPNSAVRGTTVVYWPLRLTRQTMI